MIIINVRRLPPSSGGVGRLTADLGRMGKRAVERAAAYQRKVEITSMQSESDPDKHSPIGQPPFTHPRGRTRRFPSFIRFSMEQVNGDTGAVVGPQSPVSAGKNWAERIGHTHEFGGRYLQTAAVRYGTAKRPIKPKINLFAKGGVKAFNWKLLRYKKYKNGVRKFTISYWANYPKRPFAAPALSITAAKILAGGFGK